MPEEKAETFEAFVSKERKRLSKERDAALERKNRAEQDIKHIDRELKAITAYEVAKRGGTSKVDTKRGGTRRVGIRAEVLAVIKKHPDGINRADILYTMHAKGDRAFEGSVSNALAALKKKGLITNSDGQYIAA